MIKDGRISFWNYLYSSNFDKSAEDFIEKSAGDLKEKLTEFGLFMDPDEEAKMKAKEEEQLKLMKEREARDKPVLFKRRK